MRWRWKRAWLAALLFLFGPSGKRESQRLLISWKIWNKSLKPLLCVISWNVLDFLEGSSMSMANFDVGDL